LSLLGSGGYADVYLYERDQPKIRVAVKLMKASVLDDAKRRQFAAEADAMAELAEHPFIVPVLGAGTAPDGRPYLVMQYYPSSDLAVRVAANPMSVPDALRYGIQMASAVETAHRADIIHRDIKPSNILLSSYGHPGLSDFGIAGRPNDTSDDGEVGVSMPWSPPEVLTGGSNGSVTSDVYSLAATVWTLLVGHAPFHIPGGDNSERATFTRIVHTKPPATGRGDATASLDRLLQQALAKDPAHRPQSAIELARHLQRVEQELRLARTEAVVLDQGGAAVVSTTPTSPHDTGIRSGFDATSVSARTPAPVDDSATQRRAPLRVGSVQAPATPPAPKRGPGPAPTLVSASSPGPAGGTLPAKQTPARSGRVTEDPAASRPTKLRPRTAAPVQNTSSVERPRRDRRTPLLASVAVAVLAVTATILVVAAGGSKPAPGKIVTTSQADTNATDAVPDASPAPTDPSTVSGHQAGSHVVFSWPAVSGVSEYRWSIGNASSNTTAATHVRVSKPATGRLCVTVHSVAPGYPISTGRRGCAG
jgi:serine/threonine protein kinase